MEFISEPIPYRIYPLGEEAISIEWQHEHANVAHVEVIKAQAALQQAALPGIREMVPAYKTLSLFLDYSVVAEKGDYEYFIHRLDSILIKLADEVLLPHRQLSIPVCYSADMGPDLNAASAFLGITMDELIEKHTAQEYDVFMLGFVPGFPYLGWVDESIALPRLQQARASVAAGSVGIAGRQTGIYPSNVPGGWQIIGRTPLMIFNPDAEPPFLFQAGDKVRFFAITEDEFYSGKFNTWPS